MVSAVLNKPHADITSVFHFERSTYSHIHRLFRPMDVEHNHKTFARVFNSTESGFIPPWAKNIEERVDGFINLAMNVREVFKPSFHDVSRWVRQTTNIKKGKERNFAFTFACVLLNWPIPSCCRDNMLP